MSADGDRLPASRSSARITAVTAWQLPLTGLEGGYGFGNGRREPVTPTTLVRIDTDAGVSGWGEACPLGAAYLPASAEGIAAALPRLAHAILGADACRPGTIVRLLDEAMAGEAFAKSALDMACHDALGRAAGLPLHVLLGGAFVDEVPLYWSVAQADPDTMAESAQRARAAGYRHLQIKVGGDPGTDVERIGSVASAAAPGELLLCDANRGWRRLDALRVLGGTAELAYAIEQPCDRYDDCLAVRRAAQRPFKLDESVRGMDDLVRATRDDACDMVAIKIAKSGGLARARVARDHCAALGLPMTVEDVWGGDLVGAACAHLAASTPPEALLHTADLHNYHAEHHAGGGPTVADGRMTVPTGPGLGYVPDANALGEPIGRYGAAPRRVRA
jgi:L-alanine-DL-glutamate epimerase-like enolase superfamily enzyme